MRVSQCSFRRLRLTVAASVLLASTGCATVRPEERELLADPSMTFNAGAMAQRHEQHVLDNREGSSGAGSATGGGCGCN